MIFAGFIKTSLIDYPDKIASVVFLPKCNFKCGFCHNGDLVFEKIDSIDEKIVFAHLKKRKKIIDGIVITGGEPTLHNGLIPFLEKIKSFNIEVKLDTNGYKPYVINDIIKKNLVNYFAMDIKNCEKEYANTADVKDLDIEKIKKTIEIIKNSNCDYEFRTTLIKEFHTDDNIEKIFALAKNSKKFVIQQYSYSDKQIINEKYSYYTIEEMNIFKEKYQEKYNIKEVYVRGRY